MRISPALVLAGALWSSVLFLPSSSAQPGHRVAFVDDTQLTNDSLKSMLDGLGDEPKALSKGYLIAVKHEGWTINMQLVLSADNTKLGFNANLGVVEDPDGVTAAQWRGLLEENREIDPSAFYYDKDQKKLYMHRVLDNRGITPAYLRTQIDNFCANVKDTNDYWKFTK